MADQAAVNDINPLLRCSACNLSFVYPAQFALHFRRVNHTFPIFCGQGPEQDPCGSSFNAVKSLLRHIRETHNEPVRAPDLHEGGGHHEAGDNEGDINEDEDINLGGDINEGRDNNIGNINQEEAHGDAQEDPLLRVENVDMGRSAAMMVLNLRQSALTTSSIQRVQDECYKMMIDTRNLIKGKVIDFLRNENLINLPSSRDLLRELDLSNPFRPIRTLKQQLAYFAREMGLVVPVPLFLDYRPDFRLNPETNQYEPTQVSMTFQYIPIIDTLRLILSNPKLRELIELEQPSKDGVLRSYLDGTRVKTNNLIQQFPNTIRLQLNWDDLEVVNPLGSKTVIHKLAAFYFSIQNFPQIENSQLSSVFLLALAYSEDIKEMKGFHKVLDPFLRDLKKLESEDGVDFNIGNDFIRQRATLCTLCADTLAAHDILGFMGPGARHFCRVCTVSRQGLHQNCNAIGDRRTPESHAAHVEQVKARPAFATECGVKRDSPLKKAKYFSVTEDAPFDIFHDLLEGVCHIVIIMALYTFTVTDKFFTLKQFNARVSAFNYGVPDRKNKPSVNLTEEQLKKKTLRKLNQSGIQMWCLTRAFGFLVPEVPEDHPHLQLVNLLQEIVLILFSREIRPLDIAKLDSTITEHHTLFQALCANVQEFDGEEQADDPEDDPDDPEAAAGPARLVLRPAARPVKPINKLHHMKHLAEQMEKFGPLILYWCARYEGRHHIFCKFAAICHNFINLPKTMAQMHQISTLCGILKESRRSEEIELHSSTEHLVQDCEHSNLLMDKGLQGDAIILSVGSVIISGEDFRPGLFVIADTSPCFAIIQQIYVQDGEVNFVILKWETEEFVRRYCAYRIKPNPCSRPMLLEHKSLAKHGSYAPWNPFNQRVTFISPRFLIF
ncbi:Heat-inducible transcription repressor [Frankliniella fusca]|uniref:Heat-inducible transcription repressor n=1 Tax=Frankliniella fusca TaxID=407009 RepID=A0AAE1I4W5_9NEOP|nr:Heat-inducible transcription repressor [Frankliniella fusca]